MFKFLWFLPAGFKNQNKVTDATAPIYSYSQNTCQAASPSLPYAHMPTCAPGIRYLCKYLQDVPHLPEMIINVLRISLITKHSVYTHRLFHGSSPASLWMSLHVFPPLPSTAYDQELEPLHLSCRVVWIFIYFQAGREKFVKQQQCPSRHREHLRVSLGYPYFFATSLHAGSRHGWCRFKPEVEHARSVVWQLRKGTNRESKYQEV